VHNLTVLDNGFRVISSRLSDVNSITIGIWIKTGGRYENLVNQGISHLMEHMLFKGTKKRSCQALKSSIESKGGAFNAFTSEENVCYYIKILSNRLALAGDVLADMVLSPSLKKLDIEKEKKVIFEEIRMYLDLPMQYVYDLLDRLIWPGHPLGLPLVGTYETVRDISRADLVRQRDTFYVPNNMMAVCCGNIDHDRLVRLMEGLFSRQARGRGPGIVPVGKARGGSPLEFMRKDTEQTHICLGVRGVSSNDPRRYALSLLGIILGGNMSSRLFNEIREKRSLAYEIGASMKAYSDTGSFFVHAGIDNKKLLDAVSVIIDELSKVRKYPVTNREFSMAKEYFKSNLLMAMESSMSNMMFLGEQITGIGKIQTKEQILKVVDRVTPSDIQDIAKKIFTKSSLRLAVIGPQGDDEIARVLRSLH